MTHAEMRQANQRHQFEEGTDPDTCLCGLPACDSIHDEAELAEELGIAE